MTPGHQARSVFLKDVEDTYNRLTTRAAAIREERAANPGGGDVEQIQLHAVDPGTEINISVPPKDSTDPETQEARKTFEAFPPGLQRALETGELDEVNKVLGKMSVEEAEEVVRLLGEGGMLSLEEGVIDATTEEGQDRLKELEKEARESNEAPAEKEPEPIRRAVDEVD
jgi:cell division cycle protein 37